MGWSGVWLVLRRPGESDEDAIARTTAGYIELREGVPHLVPVQHSGDVVPPPDGFIDAVTELVLQLDPTMRATRTPSTDGDLIWVDIHGDGPVLVTVYTSEVQLRAVSDRADPPGREGMGFEEMWRYAKAIAERFDCVAHDPDYDEIIDLSLPVDEARAVYAWV